MSEHRERITRWSHYWELLILIALIALSLRFFLFIPLQMIGEDMAPSLQAGDVVIGFKAPYGFRFPFFENKVFSSLPVKGDIVAVEEPGRREILILRAIGLPGDRVEFRQGQLFLNDKNTFFKKINDQLDEVEVDGRYFVLSRGTEDRAPVVVPPGHVFFLGDNVPLALDSRQLGSLPMKNLVARVSTVLLAVRGDEKGISGILWHRSLRSLR